MLSAPFADRFAAAATAAILSAEDNNPAGVRGRGKNQQRLSEDQARLAQAACMVDHYGFLVSLISVSKLSIPIN